MAAFLSGDIGFFFQEEQEQYKNCFLMLKNINRGLDSYHFEDEQPAHRPNSFEVENSFYTLFVFYAIYKFSIYKQFPC